MTAGRALSLAEEQGWRRFWDGWIICSPCIEEHQRQHKAFFKEESHRGWPAWPVPADYDTPIGEASAKYDSGCMKCGKKPPLELTWKTFHANADGSRDLPETLGGLRS